MATSVFGPCGSVPDPGVEPEALARRTCIGEAPVYEADGQAIRWRAGGGGHARRGAQLSGVP